MRVLLPTQEQAAVLARHAGRIRALGVGLAVPPFEALAERTRWGSKRSLDLPAVGSHLTALGGAPDLGMAPGQPNRWTLNQRWKVLIVASWDHSCHRRTCDGQGNAVSSWHSEL